MSFDIYIEEGLNALKAMENYIEVARKVKEIAQCFDPNAKVYVFGSVVEGKYTAASDIDILVVTTIERDRVYEFKARIYSELDAPVELHVVHPSKLEWYRRFAGKLVEV